MKSAILLSLTSLFLQSSLALAGEDNWAAASFQLPSLQNQISGYQTETGSFRMERAETAKSTIELSGSPMGRDLEKAKMFCQLQGNALRTIKDHSKNNFKLEALAYPISDEELRRARLQIENKPNLYNVEVRLALSEKSITTPESAQNFQNAAEWKIKTQLDSLRATGRLSIELPQIDDVFCDLISGNAHLTLHFSYSQIPAKHQRETVITGSELARVHEGLKQLNLQSKDLAQRQILSGALLGSVLQKELGKSLGQLEEKRFLQIHQGLFSKDTASLKPLTENQYDSAARNMDLLSLDMMMALLKTEFDVKIGAR